MATYKKSIENIFSSKKQESNFYDLTEQDLKYTLIDRTSSADENSNYFASFNLPSSKSAFPSGSTLANSAPELYQLNVDKAIMIPISKDFYAEKIDGKTLTLEIPQEDGNSFSSKTIISTTYSTSESSQDSVLLGNNIAFLFSDDINTPFSGTTAGEQNDHSNRNTWESGNTPTFEYRPPAVSYSDLDTSNSSNNDVGSDPRSSINYAVNVPTSYPTGYLVGYSYDIPIGFVSLDKGFVVITHPEIVNNFPWDNGYFINSNGNEQANTSPVLKENIYFKDANKSRLTYKDVDVFYTTSVVCLALQEEFFLTTNPSWPLSSNISEFQNGTNNFDSIYVTEVGLYNRNNELIAVSKFDRPVEKSFTNILTFTLNIDV